MGLECGSGVTSVFNLDCATTAVSAPVFSCAITSPCTLNSPNAFCNSAFFSSSCCLTVSKSVWRPGDSLFLLLASIFPSSCNSRSDIPSELSLSDSESREEPLRDSSFICSKTLPPCRTARCKGPRGDCKHTFTKDHTARVPGDVEGQRFKSSPRFSHCGTFRSPSSINQGAISSTSFKKANAVLAFKGVPFVLRTSFKESYKRARLFPILRKLTLLSQERHKQPNVRSSMGNLPVNRQLLVHSLPYRCSYLDPRSVSGDRDAGFRHQLSLSARKNDPQMR